MKRSISGVVVLLAGAFVGNCQGTVSFANYAVLSNYIYAYLEPGNVPLGSKSAMGFPGIEPPDDPSQGVFWTVALYGAAGWDDAASSLVQLETSGGQPVVTTFADGTSDSLPGTWISSVVAVVPGTTLVNGEATIQIYAWCNLVGGVTNYSEAVVLGLPAGFSMTANVITGGGTIGIPLPSGTGPGELGNIFLSIPPAVSPILTATANADRSGDLEQNSIILTWPTTNGVFTLQSTTNLVSPIVWTNVSIEPVIVNGQNTVTNIISGGQQLFRLVYP